ncbi:MAG: histidinol phosphate phosphatase [Thermoleophilia bacterium]|nr:histidinol phosphate phosphatase [Thermoleophilia bacterium]
MLTDYHMHLQPDGVAARAADAHRWDAMGGPRSSGWIGRYVEVARTRAVDEIAITEHVHRFTEVRDWHPNAWWRDEATEDLSAHCAALVSAREDEGLPVLVGIEMDWIPDRRDDIRALLASHPFDIVLGSVHWLGDLAIDHPDYPCWDALGTQETWARYFDELAAAAVSGLFDVLAHPDLPKVFGTPMPDALTARRDEVIAVIGESGVAVECSSAGLRKPCRALYPDPDWLSAFRRAGVPVTLASDAHRPEDVARDYPTAVAALRGAGYDTITRFRAREAEQVKIRWA